MIRKDVLSVHKKVSMLKRVSVLLVAFLIILNSGIFLPNTIGYTESEDIMCQAEDATIYHGFVDTLRAGYTGTGYVNYDNEIGSYVEFNINVITAGEYSLSFRYANGNTSNRSCGLIVNGDNMGGLNFAPTGDWETWQTESKAVSLNTGSNIIRVTSTNTDGGPNLDGLCISECTSSLPPINPDSVVVPYKSAFNASASTRYSVQVNGQDVFVEAYKDYNYVHFAFAGEVNVRITCNEDVISYKLSPESYNIASTKNGRNIDFYLNVPRKLVLHELNSSNKNGSEGDLLFIIAEPMEENPPQLGDPGVINVMDYVVDNTGVDVETANIQDALDYVSGIGGGVVYFPPGVYRSGTIRIHDNVTIYLENGALIMGSGNEEDYYYDPELLPNTDRYDHEYHQVLFQDSENSKLIGRGTIDGNGKALRDKISSSGRNVTFKHSNNCILEGVVLRSSINWSGHISYSDNITVRNVKIFQDPNNKNGDGINSDCSVNILYDDNLYCTFDDSIALKASLRYAPAPEYVCIVRNCENIFARNCVIWSNRAGLKAGNPDIQAEYVRNATFENIDIVGCDNPIQMVDNGSGKIMDIRFRNVRVEKHITRPIFHPSMNRLIRIEGEVGGIENIYFEDVNSLVYFPSNSVIHGYNSAHPVSNVQFDNCKIAGNQVTSLSTGKINVNSYVNNIGFNATDFQKINVTASELFTNEGGDVKGKFTITRAGSLLSDLVVNFSLRGTAKNGIDYDTISNYAIIPEGQASVDIFVNAKADTENELLETVILYLDHSSDRTYMLDKNAYAAVNIIDMN